MATITDSILYAIRCQADQIHRIKAAALKTRQLEKYLYVSPEGAVAQRGQSLKEIQIAGYRMTKVLCERVIDHISPAHAGWERYRAARHRASLLLTARLLLKLGGESIPDLGAVRRALEEGQLTHHSRRGGARSLSFAAWRYLRKLDNRLKRAPERFSVVEEWLMSRRSHDANFIKEEANV